MRIKRLLVASLFLLVTAGAGAAVQHKDPVDSGTCTSGEYWCVTTPGYTEMLPNGTIVVHAPRTECRCAG